MALRGRKQLRPIILLEVCWAATLWRRRRGEMALVCDPAEAALFAEYLHTGSLVIDNLPAFDDDAERRGGPSVHAAMGPAVENLAALSLLSATFQSICRQIDWIRDHCLGFKGVVRVRARLCHDVSRAMGAAGGQFMDLSPDRLGPPEGRKEAVLRMVQLKTATFSFLVGMAHLRGSPSPSPQRADQLFGTTFQIADNVGDMGGDAAGRAAG
ncbi:MAG: polyprenyl synthetase family protein [Candidatus Thiodiazotropha sp.]